MIIFRRFEPFAAVSAQFSIKYRNIFGALRHLKDAMKIVTTSVGEKKQGGNWHVFV